MLKIDPSERLSAKQALSHSCFEVALSKSPLISKPFFNGKEFIQQQNLTDQHEHREHQKKHYYNKNFNRIEDLSPSPLPQNRMKSPNMRMNETLEIWTLT